MSRFARSLATWITVAFFAAASVAWASSAPIILDPPSIGTVHHEHADASVPVCEVSDYCTVDEPERHVHTHGGEEDAATCCDFACHVIDEPAAGHPLTGSPPPRGDSSLDAPYLIGANPCLPDRPPRLG